MTPKRWLIVGVVASLAVVGGAWTAMARSANDDDQTLSGHLLRRASQAALTEVGSGTVVEAEIGDDGAAYEVEVEMRDGTTVDVELDEQLAVIHAASGESDQGDESESDESEPSND